MHALTFGNRNLKAQSMFKHPHREKATYQRAAEVALIRYWEAAALTAYFSPIAQQRPSRVEKTAPSVLG
ncbi:unnamed protein product [Chondrus crispus]|uniref:Uncharacterized protein n=1 Tax=Chondrus crispus TaxID=2769 RepID=R7QI43_CHOCR|nr:unnamed protein product [Chondrus crispus]CDF38187.1 unnamed protein product [Chondrus crispus]|eukprot:XP_005718056.1 unnamed protein product [Chondrus crispus]